MTPLRQRMIEDMQPRGLSARTQESCVSAVRHLATDFHVSPDRLTEEDLWQWTDGLINADCFGTVGKKIGGIYVEMQGLSTGRPPIVGSG